METFLLIGGGELGRRIGVLLRQRYPGVPIHVQTRTIEKHPALQNLGLTPGVWPIGTASETAKTSERFSHVIVAVPPRQSPGDLITRSLSLWNQQGAFAYVSSTGVYAEASGGWIQEDSDRAQGANVALENFEDTTLAAGGWVVRLAGLYSESRGPHRVYRAHRKQASNPNSWINLIHDDDAAEFCVRTLISAPKPDFPPNRRILLGADGTPLTRAHLATSAAEISPATPVCQFTDTTGPLGKRCDPKKSWALLGFTPRFHSFDHFARNQSRAK